MRDYKDKFVYSSSTVSNRNKFAYFIDKVSLFKDIYAIKSFTSAIINFFIWINALVSGKPSIKNQFYSSHKLYKSL